MNNKPVPVSKEDVMVIRLIGGHVESVTWRDPQGKSLYALCKIEVVCDCTECQMKTPESCNCSREVASHFEREQDLYCGKCDKKRK